MLEYLGVRMPVAVVGPHTDDRDTRPDGSEELGEGGVPTVVRNFEHPRLQEVGPAQQRGLRGTFGVAYEQDTPPILGDPDHDRHVVDDPVGPDERVARRRAQHFDQQGSDHRCLPAERCRTLLHGGSDALRERVRDLVGVYWS